MQKPDLPKEAHEKRVEEILGSALEEHKSWLERKLKVVNEPSLDQRLHEILKRHRGISDFVVGKEGEARDEFVKKVVATRNYRTHFDESKKDKAAQGVEELYRISRQLRLLLEACLMQEIGFDPEETKAAISGMR